ncbi:hypothetical protein FUAX_08150 [Fulvitalea axinellae]|uniref:Uncharacterized protein n=1 Tax=Fulvitalea axinellae TaxID=1182444 RepID=A0AAU9CET9_9BACT|nr:hypothetical protein FUAX_08150 [Fulvitalea axinellae]
MAIDVYEVENPEQYLFSIQDIEVISSELKRFKILTGTSIDQFTNTYLHTHQLKILSKLIGGNKGAADIKKGLDEAIDNNRAVALLGD